MGQKEEAVSIIKDEILKVLIERANAHKLLKETNERIKELLVKLVEYLKLK